MRIVRKMPEDFLSLSGAEKRPSGHSPCMVGWAQPGRSRGTVPGLQGGRTGWLALRRERLLLALGMVGDSQRQPFWMLRGLGVKGHP